MARMARAHGHGRGWNEGTDGTRARMTRMTRDSTGGAGAQMALDLAHSMIFFFIY